MQLIGFQRVNENGNRELESDRHGENKPCVCGGGKKKKDDDGNSERYNGATG